MNIKRNVVRRTGSLAAAVAVALGALVPAITPLVSAAAQVQTRSIEISDSTPGMTGVLYKTTFTPTTAGAQSLIIDFCSNSSIIGGNCTAPTGMNASTLTFTAGTGTTGWALGTGSASQIKLTKGTGSALSTTAVDFTVTGVTNPTPTPGGTFWARIYTYNDISYGSTTTVYTSPTALGDYKNYGGFALSTAQLINITATVMETLTFCTSKTAPTPGCTGTVTPDLVLGHGTPKIIDSTVVDTDDAYFQISTNALTGAIVRMKTHNTCSGLSRDGGVSCQIVGLGTTGTPVAFTAAAAQYGMRAEPVAGGVGTVNPLNDYNSATNYGMGAGVTSTYGDPIANTNATATADVNTKMTFAAQASVTTPAGVYSVNESLIATGTF